MGFFSDVLAPAIGGIGGLFLGGPAGALVGAGIGSSISGANKQADALEAAGKTQEAQQLRQLALSEQLLAEGKPVREAQSQAALGAFPLLTQDINREPGTGLPFEQALSRGTEGIMSSLAPFGLVDSSVSGRAVGDFTSGLLGQDIARQQDARFRLAGFAPQTTSAGINLLGQAGGTAGNIAGLQQNLGAVQGGTFGNISNALLGLGGNLLSGSNLFS